MTNLEWFKQMDACTLSYYLTGFNLGLVRRWLSKNNLGYLSLGWWDNSPKAIECEDAVEMWLNAEHEPWPGEEVVDDE